MFADTLAIHTACTKLEKNSNKQSLRAPGKSLLFTEKYGGAQQDTERDTSLIGKSVLYRQSPGPRHKMGHCGWRLEESSCGEGRREACAADRCHLVLQKQKGQ